MAKLLTDKQRRAIQRAINDHHLAFIAEALGPSAISEEDYKRLKAAGKIRGKAPLVIDAATAAHILGVVTHGMASNAEKLSAGTFWEMVREDPGVLSQTERDAIEATRERVGEHIKGLGNKLDTATGHIIIDANDKLRRQNLTKVREAVATGIASRESAKQVAQRIRDATGDVKRDWTKIAQTEMHNASEEAKAVSLVKEHGGDPLVYKRVRPDACAFCRLLYMDGKRPRVFRLSDLQANGTNVGRKANRPRLTGTNATEYKAVLGAMHPWCQCTVHHLPDGLAFDADGNLTTLKKSLIIESLDRALLNHECE